MKRSFFLSLFFFLFSNATTSALLESGQNAYIKILERSGIAGAAATATPSNNSDENSKWGAACDLVSSNRLCWSDAPYIPFTIKRESKYLSFSLYAADGYGSGTITLPNGSTISTTLDLAGYQSADRHFRLQFPFNVNRASASCGYSASTTPTAEERARGIVSVFIVSTKVRWTTCQFEFDSFSIDNDVQGAVSFAGSGLRYNPNIFSQVTAGRYLINGKILADKLNLTQFIDSTKTTTVDSAAVFDSFKAYLNINVIGYVKPIILLSSGTIKQAFDPRVDTIKRYQFDMAIDTNSRIITALVNCQYTIAARCALSNGNELLPIEIGFRADYSGGLPTKILAPGERITLDRNLGYIISGSENFVSKVSLIFTLYANDVKMLKTAQISPDYSGTMTFITEVKF